MSFLISDEVVEDEDSIEIGVYLEDETAKPSKYTKEDIQNALREISNGSQITAAARNFNIPLSTLKRRLKGEPKPKGGKVPVIGAEDEGRLADWIIQSARKGDCRSKEQVIRAANELLSISGVQRDNPLGNGWMEKFMNRHPNISFRTPQVVTRSSANVTETDIRRFFTKFKAWLEEENYQQAFEDPRRVLNSDETGYELNAIPKKVLAGKGLSNVFNIERAASKKRVSVMYTFSADGSSYRPQLIVPVSVSEVLAQPEEFSRVVKMRAFKETNYGVMTSATYLDACKRVSDEKKKVEAEKEMRKTVRNLKKEGAAGKKVPTMKAEKGKTAKICPESPVDEWYPEDVEWEPKRRSRKKTI